MIAYMGQMQSRIPKIVLHKDMILKEVKQKKEVRRGVQAANKDESQESQKRGTANFETSIASASEREDAVVSSPSYDKMEYRELQSLCKQRGIKANEKKAVLVEALKHWHASKKSKEF